MAENNNLTPEDYRKLTQSMSELAAAMNNGSRSHGDYADAQNEAGNKIKRSGEETKAALKQFSEQIGESALSYGKALVTGGEGTAKFGPAIEGAGNAAFNLGKSFGLIGGVIGGIIKIFGGLASASLKQNDVMMKSYRDLSEMGSVSGTLEKVMSDFNKVGLTSEEAEKFGNMLRKVTPELSVFGGSVSLGKDKLVGVISGMIGPGNQIERSMARIGYGAEEMRDATADYIAKQSRLGLSQGKTEKELRDGSVKYMTTLRELQELTGMSRDEAQKAIDASRNNAKYAMTLANMNEKEALAVDTYMAAYRKRFGSQAADDLIEQFVNKGAVVGEASARSAQSTLNQGYDQLENVRRGIIDSEKGINNAGLAMAENYKRLGPSIMVATDGLNDLTGDNAQKLGAMGESGRKLVGINQNLSKTMAISGDRIDKNIDIEQKQRQMRIAADNALMAVGNLVVNMFQKLNDMMFKFAKMLALMIDKFGVFVGLGKTNLSEGFRDQTDNAKDLQRAKGKSVHGEGLVHQGVDNAAQDYKAAMAGNTDSLNKQMKEQENFIDKLKAQSKDEKLTPLERALAEERYKLEKKRYDDMDEEYGASRGFRDLEKVKELRIKRLNDAMKAEADLKDQIKKLEEEKLRMNQADSTAAAAVASGAISQQTNAQGQLVGQDQLEARKTAAAGLSQGVAGRTNDVLSKLNFKNREENTGGGEADPALIGLAEKISQAFPNSTFTALNDKFHKDQRKSSSHTRGKALDVALNPAPKTPEEAAIFREKMKDLGASKVLDEYFADKNAGTTGGHFHAEVARDGGIFSGPKEGYPVILHGNEAVVPMPNLDNFVSDVKKDSLDSIKGMGTGNQEPVIQKIESGINPEFMNSMMSMMADKFDEMIRHLDNSNSTQQQILTYTKA